MPFRGRRPRTRRFVRPDPPAPPSNAPLDDPILHSPPKDYILPDEAPSGQTTGPSQDSTAGLTDMGGREAPQADTSGALSIIPDPPGRVEFACPCGMLLVATREFYDRRSRCPGCKTVLLLNLVYKRDLGAFEIEPFRVDSESRP